MAIGEKLCVKTELVPVTSANHIPYLQTNKVELVTHEMKFARDVAGASS